MITKVLKIAIFVSCLETERRGEEKLQRNSARYNTVHTRSCTNAHTYKIIPTIVAGVMYVDIRTLEVHTDTHGSMGLATYDEPKPFMHS